MTTIKAVRATINLGGIELDVFQLPDGEYRLSQVQILEIIELPKNWISRLQSSTPKQLERLQSKGFTGYSLEVSIDKTRAKTLTIDDATKIWGLVARSGNEKALDILEACVGESIERRADAAFGMQRSLSEYNERLKAKISRRTLTDSIKAYLERHPEVSDNYRTWIYKNVTNAIYRAVFSMDAKKLSEALKCNKDEIRDNLDQFCVSRIVWIEESVCQQIDLDFEPQEAVKRVVEFNSLKTIQAVKPQDTNC
jgi:hypothetical protein